jgi:LysM repeat protein
VLSIARRNHVSIAELAKANDLDRSAKLKLGMKLTVPGAKSAQRATASASPTTKLAAVTPKPQEKTQLAQATTTPAKLARPDHCQVWPVGRGRIAAAAFRDP